MDSLDCGGRCAWRTARFDISDRTPLYERTRTVQSRQRLRNGADKPVFAIRRHTTGDVWSRRIFRRIFARVAFVVWLSVDLEHFRAAGFGNGRVYRLVGVCTGSIDRCVLPILSIIGGNDLRASNSFRSFDRLTPARQTS